MLDKSDTETVRDWLLVALTVAEAQGKTASDLAAWCHVSPQAVNGWKKTGRITKSNLERAALFFGSGPSFTPGASYGAREPAHGGWPFPDIEPERFQRLSANQKIEIQGVVRDRLDKFEAASKHQADAEPPSTARPTAAPRKRTPRPR